MLIQDMNSDTFIQIPGDESLGTSSVILCIPEDEDSDTSLEDSGDIATGIMFMTVLLSITAFFCTLAAIV